nr:uncharacterized protein LOC119178669 isoform X6 [Rhipicephalus microplus]
MNVDIKVERSSPPTLPPPWLICVGIKEEPVIPPTTESLDVNVDIKVEQSSPPTTPLPDMSVDVKVEPRSPTATPPPSYLNRPQVTLGSCPEARTGFEISLVNEPSSSEVSSQPLGTAVSKLDIPSVDEPSIGEVPSQPAISFVSAIAAPSLSELCKSITEEWEKCSSLLYCCCDVQALSEAKGLLQATFRKLAESGPQTSDLHIRGSSTKGCSLLEPLPKRKRL